MDDALPQSVEAQEELDFLAADDGADRLHGAFAAGALQRVAAPDLQDEVAPERAHVAGGLLGRRWDEEDLGGRRLLGWRFGLGLADDAVRDGGGLAAGFVGIEAVVADGLLALGREVVDGSSDEVGGLEDLEVALGGVVAFGAVDDGLGGGVPGDFLKGEGMTKQILGEALAPSMVVGLDPLFRSGVDVKAGVFPGEKVGEFLRAD